MNSFVYCEEAGDLTGNAAAKAIDESKKSQKTYSTGNDEVDYILNEVIEDEYEKDRFNCFWKQFDPLIEQTASEVDNMWDDYRYDHDNYDSLDRERKLRQMKDRLMYLQSKMREILEPYEYYFNPCSRYSILHIEVF